MHVKWTSEEATSLCAEGLELLMPCINNDSTQYTCDSTQQMAQQLDLSAQVKIAIEFRQTDWLWSGCSKRLRSVQSLPRSWANSWVWFNYYHGRV